MAGKSKCGQVVAILLKWKCLLIVSLVPILFLPVAFVHDTKVSRCAYAVIVIGFFWVTEALPLAVTSLLPVLLFPVLEVVPVKQICASYFKDTLMLFLGSLIVAVAVERWNLHKRIALRALTLVGPEPKMLMLGIMVPCWFLSMWMSNTATTAMMVPILNAILLQIKECNKEVEESIEMIEDGTTRNQEDEEKAQLDKANGLNNHEIDFKPDSDRENTKNVNLQSENKDFVNLAKTFALCTAFAANIGGIATLTGTPPNIVFKGLAESLFAEYKLESGVTFANWLVIGLPLSFICLVVTWFWLQVYYKGKRFFSCKKDANEYASVKSHLQNEYDNLGPMTFAETVVLIDFVMLAVLWVTRKPEFIPGWGSLFLPKYVGDSCPAVLMAVVLFVLPSKAPNIRCSNFRKTKNGDDLENEVFAEDDASDEPVVPLLNWDIVNQKLAWGVIILMGGGFALADACSASGLSDAISKQLTVLGAMPEWLIALVLAYIVAAATNITSNSATATLFLPIVGKLAIQLQINPLYFMIPCALAASFAFLLPVGTPPNAIVFSTGYLTVKDMVIGGSFVNFVTVLFVSIAMNLWIIPFYDLNTLPAAMSLGANTTSTLSNLTTTVATNDTAVIKIIYNCTL